MESIKILQRRSLKFLKSLISLFRTAISEPITLDELSTEEQSTRTLLDHLGLSPQAFNCLLKSEVRGIENVTSKLGKTLLDVHGFGINALNELKIQLADYDLSNKNDEPIAPRVK